MGSEMCIRDSSCFSYNFGPLEGGVHKCELNDADSVSHRTDLVQRNGWVYQTAEVLVINDLPCGIELN